ncbi:NAD(P)/FAD-dependent oxidoreductase [Taibaiella chishuiensis]|uniref:Flavin-dependent dehydrogenase n=1 Tax=Taibaiella chishuiensis TaxID=1434707 RepID=A0A2P8D4A9_9BACT|nr:NAD(P)/FAD-dependent oxidoreductase [Taibaiella chishuiensis]PSK92046.1 flavin-dependent dehydrogenase [Taibaiella chishuiensis]
MITTDVLVIGAGPSGTVAAAIIKKAGFDVRIVEKQQFPRFVIGESLLPRCLDALTEAGFMDALKAKHFQEKTGAKFVRNNDICDFTFEKQHTDGLKYAWQMPRADFDLTLADECQRMGIDLSYKHEVTAIEIAEDGSSITTIQPEEGEAYQVKARFIVDGSGYGRVIPRLFNLEKPSTQPARKTVFAHMTDPKRLEQEEPNRIVVYVHRPDCWVWTIPFATGNTSVGYVSNPEFFEPYTGTPEEQFRAMIAAEPALHKRFGDAELIFEPRTLQGWSATTDTFWGNGFVLTGNVTEFLDPIFSSGVTLATVSAQLAAKLVIRQLNGETVDWHKEYTEPTMQGVNVFRTYVNSWYDGTLFKIFFAENKSEEVKEQICSVLAGYVWDLSNPFVKNHEKSVKTLARFLDNTIATS